MSKKHRAHGGAWKVAYADFVTAMMALFIVLWLSSQDQRIKEAIQRSFTNPFMSLTDGTTGLIDRKKELPQQSQGGQGENSFGSPVELTMLKKIEDDLLKMLHQNEEEESVKLELTPEGLRISVFDRARRPIFEPDSEKFTPYGAWVFSTLAWSIAREPTFRIELEGHTERGHAPARENYDNWELTADRANAARRQLLQHGVGVSQIRKVAGYADTQPMPNVAPDAETNRRVSVMLKVGDKSKT